MWISGKEEIICMREIRRSVSHSLLLLPVLCWLEGAACAADFPVMYETQVRQEVKALEPVSHAPFGELQQVDGHSAGLVGDGKTDNTAIFRKLFGKPGQRVSIGPGNFRTGKFVILGDTEVILSAGTVIQDTGRLGSDEPLIQIYGKHVRIAGSGAKILENRLDYDTGEGRHGLAMLGVEDVNIDGLESSSTGGDGFYIGGPVGKPSVDVTLRNCVARNNRRQGLSITNARQVQVIDSTFTTTAGTKPEFGVDLEPNHATDYLDGIVLSGVTTSGNKGGGILIWLNQLKSSSPPVNIIIIDHNSSSERAFVAEEGDQPVGGSVRYVRIR